VINGLQTQKHANWLAGNPAAEKERKEKGDKLERRQTIRKRHRKYMWGKQGNEKVSGVTLIS